MTLGQMNGCVVNGEQMGRGTIDERFMDGRQMHDEWVK